jgi:hypothetical protein
MTAWVPPRRVTSTATTITVSSGTLLAQAANDPSGWTNGFKAFLGTNLKTLSAHPITGKPVNVLRDGHSTQQDYHPTTEMFAKGCYDPVTKRVLFMSTGTGSTGDAPNNWQINTLAIYREGPADEGWTATRSFRPPDQPTDLWNLGHGYDNNCISLATRKLFKKNFHNTNSVSFASGPFHVYNLDTGVFEASIPSPPGEDPTFCIGPADVIPTLGTLGRIWYFGKTNLHVYRLLSYDLATGTKQASDWTPVTVSGFRSPAFSFDGDGNCSMSFNPRAFAGAGAVMILAGRSMSATQKGYIVQSNGTATEVPLVPGGDLPVQPRLCKEPGGTGWLLFHLNNGTVYRYRYGDLNWTPVGTFPPNLLPREEVNITPIDEYGVVWVIWGDGVVNPNNAWLYKPA